MRSPPSISFPIWTVRIFSFKVYHDYEKRLLLIKRFCTKKMIHCLLLGLPLFGKAICLLISSVARHQDILAKCHRTWDRQRNNDMGSQSPNKYTMNYQKYFTI